MARFKNRPKPPALHTVKPDRANNAASSAEGHSSRPASQLPHLMQWRRATRRKALAKVLTPLLIIGAFLLYMVSPLAKVATVTVAGEELLPAQQVIDASRLDQDTVILSLLFGRQKVATRIQTALPQVKTVTIQVQRFNQVTLVVKEYPALGYLQKADGYHLMLASGTVLKHASKTPKTQYPLFTGFGDQAAVKVAKAVRQFPAAVRQAVSEVKATPGGANPYRITMRMTDGNTVIADSRTIATKSAYYPSITGKLEQVGTVDLEVGAFFTPQAKK